MADHAASNMTDGATALARSAALGAGATGFGDSVIGLPADLGIEAPGGEVPVLQTEGFVPGEGLSAQIPLEASDLTTYTAVWDVRLSTLPNGPLALLQTNPGDGESELFIDTDGGLGVDGAFNGAVPTGGWTRIAAVVDDQGDGTALLSKYIDGTFVGQQTVDAARYMLQSNEAVDILPIADAAAGPVAVAHFGLSPFALSQEEVATLGPVDADGPFDAPEPPDGSTETVLPVRLNVLANSSSGGAFTKDTVAVDGLTFESAFSFRITTPTGTVADGLTFQIQTERDGVSLLGDTAGGFLALPEAPFPGVSVVFDTFPNAFDAGANQVRILVGGDADSTPIATADAPVDLGSGDEYFAFVDYDGATLDVFLSDTPDKPATPLLSEPVDLSATLGDTAKFGFSAATGGSVSLHDVLTFALETSDAAGPSGNLLVETADSVDLLGAASRLPAIDFDPDAPLQVGFDDFAPDSEFGFANVTLEDEPTVLNPIDDRLLKTSDGPATFDLAEVFGPEATDFAVTTTDGAIVDAVIEDGVLTLSPGDLGHADIVVTATSENGAELIDNFRAIVAGPNAYTFAILPDTQSYTSSSDPEIQALFGNMVDYLVDHKDALGIEHVIHVGDIVEFGAVEQWEIAEDAIERMDGELSYTLAVGNHDQQRPGFGSAFSFESDIDTYFTPEQVGATPEQGGGLYDGFDVGEDVFANGDTYSDSIRNSFTTLTAPDGTDWLILSLEFGAPDDVLRWAGEVIEDHLDHRVIIDTHSWNGGDKRVDPTTEPLTGENDGWGYAIRDNPRSINSGEDMWRELASKYPNVTFTFNGHNFLDGAETVVSEAAGENDVYQIFVNYQNGIQGEITGAGDPDLGGRGGNGAFRLIVIDPDNDRLTTHTKFTDLDTFFDRVDHEETFENVSLEAPEQITIAKAGGTMTVESADSEALVSLDPSASIEASATNYAWFDASGELLGATDGPPLEVSLGYGVHRLTLEATDADGNVSRDDKTVIVETEDALLVDTFDDGSADGWQAPVDVEPPFTLGTDVGLGLPAISGAGQIPLTLSFDSSFRPFDAMTGEVLLSFDGGETFNTLLTLNTETVSGGSSSLEQANERVSLDVLVPETAQEVEIAWRLSEGDNDWWWAIDDVTLTATDGSTLFAESFDDLPLQGPVDEADPGVLGWTPTPPAGWSQTVSPDTSQGTTEWQGWTFASPDFWVRVAGDQDRSTFTLGDGVVAIADPDEWDDVGGADGNTDEFDSTLQTPPIDISSLASAAPGGVSATVAEIDALTPDEIISVTPTAAGLIDEYTIIFDFYLSSDDANSFTALYQTDPTNTSDAEIYIREDGGIGISGVYEGQDAFAFDAWNRIALTFEREGDTQVLHKYIDGTFVGEQVVDSDLTDGSRWTIDGDAGVLLFSEGAGFTSNLAVSAVTFTPDALAESEIAALGGVDVNGPLDSAPSQDAFQLNFDGGLGATDFGTPTVENLNLADDLGSYLVKGSIFGNPDGEGEAEVFAQTNGPDEVLVYAGEGASAWSDYVFDMVIDPADNDTIGAVFYYQDEDNYYELAIDQENQTRTLTRVKDGVASVIAEEGGDYRHDASQDLRIAVSSSGIIITLDDDLLFDGPVVDVAPLSGGSVGFLSRSMDRASFDNVVVTPQSLSARALGERHGVDLDGDGTALLSLNANATISPSPLISIEWLMDGEIVATGSSVQLAAPAGASTITLRVEDVNGAVSRDTISVKVTSTDEVLLIDDFTTDAVDFTVVDGGAIDAPSSWMVQDGAFLQDSDIRSGQQETGFGAWSLGGEGAYILRDGTYALYDDAAAFGWTDYAVETTITPSDNDGLGILFRYQDADNYYKLEIDQEVGVIQLTRHEDGYETVLARGWGGYTPGETLTLRAEVSGNSIKTFLNDREIFGTPVRDDTLTEGTIALYSWGSTGLSFDDVTVTSLPADGPSVREEVLSDPWETIDYQNGRLVLRNFDTKEDDSSEATFDTLNFEFGGENISLTSAKDFVDFAEAIETDGVGTTDAVINGTDLMLVLSRGPNGSVDDAIILADVLGRDGLSEARLLGASADRPNTADDEDDSFLLNFNSDAALLG